MAAVTSVLKSGAKALAEPLVCVGLKAVLDLPAGGLVAWVRSRFHDHSGALPTAIAAANRRAWQAVGLALAGDSFLGHIKGLFRDGDLKAVQAQIRAFVADADTGVDGQPAGLRARACDELNRLQRAGRLSAEVELESADLTRFTSTASVTDDAHRAVRHIADDLAAEAPHLAQVLALTPAGGGTPLLSAAFAYFLRRQIAANAELARELTHDQLRLLNQKQQAGFANLETALADKWDSLEATLGGWFATTDATLDEILAELRRFRDVNQVATKPESPLRVSVTNESELQRLKKLRDRMREQPAELLDAELRSLLGDGLAAAGQFADAAEAQAGAAEAAHESHDTPAEAEAAYKQFKAACELRRWDQALAALNRAIAMDGKRFRPVPPLYDILAILGAGTFGVVLKCQDRSERDDDGNFLVVAVKTFRVADVDRPPEDVFAEASLLKKLSHPNVIGIHDRGYVDPSNHERPFLVMEFFAGETLEDWLSRNGKLSLPDFLAVFGQIAAGLHAAHALKRPIIHRDVKPANVMVQRENGMWQVKVIDFGLAVKPAIRTASLSVPHALRSTRDKSVTGTIKFAAPEQMGERPYPVGPWSDVYAFGNTALDALFGTVKPTPKHWRQLPKSLSDLLERCVDEEFNLENPAVGRFPGFAPILAVLSSVSGGEAPAIQPVPRPDGEGVAASVGRGEEHAATIPASITSTALARVGSAATLPAAQSTPKASIIPLVEGVVPVAPPPPDRQAGEHHEGDSNTVSATKRKNPTSNTTELRKPIWADIEAEYREHLARYSDNWNRSPWLKRSSLPVFRLEHAANEGSVLAMVLLGDYYRSGVDTPGFAETAMVWYRKAADAGNANAMCNIGVLYGNGEGVPQDYTEAMAWFRKAADAGNVSAMCNIGWLYDTGWGVPQDYAEAMAWFRKAADAGNVSAMFNIGVLYRNGEGVPQDYAEAMAWFRKAADAGDANAMCNIGTLYRDGKGVLQDQAQAKVWFRKAVKAGSGEAAKILEEGEKQIGGTTSPQWGTPASTPAALDGRSADLDSPQASTPPVLSSGAKTQPVATHLPYEFPSSLRTQCPHCRKKLRFSLTQVGKKAKCPKCGGMLTLSENDNSALPGREGSLVIPAAFPAISRGRKAGDRHEITLPGGVTMAFACCPPGTFLMGSPVSEKERRDSEQQHEVRLTRGFWMGIHPVTQAQYQAVMGGNPSHFRGDTLPVEQVSWNEAVAFCAALKQKTGVELRLPTEAEWEYAARGGTTTPFYWGDKLSGTQANCDGRNPYGTDSTTGPFLQKTTRVGSYAGVSPHPWGLADVIGNVWEWCGDWYAEYPEGEAVDPVGSDSGSSRVFRGGSWRSFAGRCRAVSRSWGSPRDRGFNLGFRLAAGPSGPTG